jgi:hypothetical protein
MSLLTGNCISDELFATYDSDDDGFLDWREFETLCREVYPQVGDVEGVDVEEVEGRGRVY